MKIKEFFLFIILIPLILNAQESDKYFNFNNDSIKVLPEKYNYPEYPNSYHPQLDSIPDGKYIAFIDSNSFSILNIEDEYLNGYYEYYKKDELYETGFYFHGSKSEIWKNYRNGKVCAIHYYNKGIPSESETYYENGTHKYRSITFEESQNHKIILTTQWHPNGYKKEQGLFKINSKCHSCGDCCRYKTWTNWYENGKIKSIGKYVNFKENGIWYYYDSTGVVIETIKYKRGKIKSLQKYYSEQREGKYLDVVEIYDKNKNIKLKVIEYYDEDFIFTEFYNRNNQLIKTKKRKINW